MIIDGISSSQGSAPSVSGNYVALNLGTIASGGLATITIVVTPTAAGSITDAANVSGTQYDPNKINNNAFLTTSVVATTPSIHFFLAQTTYPATGTVGHFQAFTLAVENFGPDVATNVTLVDNLPTNVAYFSATPSQGTAPTLVNGQLTENFGTLAAGAVATLQLFVIPTAIGLATNVGVVFTPDVPSAAPSYSASSVSIVAAPSVARVAGMGNNAQIAVGFNEALDPASATNPANFLLVPMGTKGTTPAKAINLAAVTYNPATQTVSLLPAQAIDPTQYYQLTVIGSTAAGVTDTFGHKLASSLYGPPGSNYSTVFFAGSLPQV